MPMLEPSEVHIEVDHDKRETRVTRTVHAKGCTAEVAGLTFVMRDATFTYPTRRYPWCDEPSPSGE